MKVCPKSDPLQSPAAAQLRQFMLRQRDAWQLGPACPVPDFQQFERELHEHLMALERELLREQLACYEVPPQPLQVAKVWYHPVLRSSETYLSAAGPVRVARQLYRASGHNTATICPLELRAGIVAGYWTPRAARLGAVALAHMTPGEAAAWFVECGLMEPSRSSLDRLPRVLSAHWEARRVEWEAALRAAEPVPRAAALVAFSVDGVLAPLKAHAGLRQAQRQQPGQQGSGPAGYREVGCGTVSLYDAAGERLLTRSYGRMPESHKVTLQTQLEAEAQALWQAQPQLRRVHLADGAPSNWQLLAAVESAVLQAAGGGSWAVPAAVQVVDFYHACEHLKRGCDAIWGQSTLRCQHEFQELRTILKEEDQGAARLIRILAHHAGRARGSRQRRIRAELTYFRNQCSRMQYAAYQREHLPIASGVMEAACKTLVTQRLKRSGMAWSQEGGQAILTLRSLLQSGRWPAAWALLAAQFMQQVTLSEPVPKAALRLVA